MKTGISLSLSLKLDNIKHASAAVIVRCSCRSIKKSVGEAINITNGRSSKTIITTHAGFSKP
jgi:hypothetical protein